ncbi:MAG: HAD family hydrolase [Phycisphaerales bacterium]|nr:HAD family hydrolase [Phycisphaerales bacterium]
MVLPRFVFTASPRCDRVSRPAEVPDFRWLHDAATVPPMQLDGVFLDMYGTLTTGDKAAVERACRHLVADFGLAMTPPELAVFWGDRFFAMLEEASHARFRPLAQLECESLVVSMRELGISAEPEPYVRHLVDYWRCPPLQPETREVLAALPVPTCIVSNVDTDDLRTAVDVTGLRVGGTVTSEETRSYKPDAHIFEVALQRTGWRRDRVIHVGDSLHSDVGGARAAGLRSAWVNRAHRIHDVGTDEPDHELADLWGLLQLVASEVRARKLGT